MPDDDIMESIKLTGDNKKFLKRKTSNKDREIGKFKERNLMNLNLGISKERDGKLV